MSTQTDTEVVGDVVLEVVQHNPQFSIDALESLFYADTQLADEDSAEVDERPI